MDNAVDEFLESRFEKYDHVVKKFGKFFNYEDLATVLERKTDLTLYDQMNVDKASREELSKTNAKIENLNQRIKHLSVL